MCIAIFKPHDKILDQAQLRICFANNPDGAGFGVSDNGELKLFKGFMTFSDFWEAFEPFQHGNAAVVHFRIGTSGLKDASNCHPWEINENNCLVHNGTMSDFVDSKVDRSDTGIFTEYVVKPLFEKWGAKAFKNGVVKYLLSKVIGTNKIIFFDNEADYFIFNEDAGSWVNGIWYSNDSYKAVKATVKYEQKPKGNAPVKYVYFLPNTDKFLSTDELRNLLQKHHCKKVGKLVKRRILERAVETPTIAKYGNDGRDALNKRLAEMAGVCL
jgi:hypothetical protein